MKWKLMKQRMKKYTKSTAQTQTTSLKYRKSPTKESLHRSPIRPSTSKIDNLRRNEHLKSLNPKKSK